MIRYILLFSWFTFCLSPFLTAQSSAVERMSYQAVALDPSGNILKSNPIQIRIAFTDDQQISEAHYSELHAVVTDEYGAFSLIIGDGNVEFGEITKVPWSEKNIFMDVALSLQPDASFKLVSRAQMLTVPYAFNARTASELVSTKELTERNQSIYWNTSGNNASRPDVHFLGTRDNKDLYIKTGGERRSVITKEGQMQVYAGATINGPDTDPASYPMYVEGIDQGIYIKVNGSRDGTKNFTTFADVDGAPNYWGRIEGQTLDELMALEAYKVQVALFALQGVSLIGSSVADILAGVGEVSSGLGALAAVGSFASGAAEIIGYASLLTESIAWGLCQTQNVGVYFSSGGADYAEYLERSIGERDLYPGEIVGIRGGQVSLNTDSADHFKIISTMPLALGNTPAEGRIKDFEKVAFMGQVPAHVAGAVKLGDYILPSGSNDGIAIAVDPAGMKTGDYGRIIGVAWSEAEFAPINTVMVAVGLNSNDLANRMENMNGKVDRIVDYLQGNGAVSTLSEPISSTSEDQSTTNQLTKVQKYMSDDTFDQFIDTHADKFTELYSTVRKQMVENGFDLSNAAHLEGFFQDPISIIKEVRRDPKYLTQWSIIDQQLLNKKED